MDVMNDDAAIDGDLLVPGIGAAETFGDRAEAMHVA
jgi:hypothetical protein